MRAAAAALAACATVAAGVSAGCGSGAPASSGVALPRSLVAEARPVGPDNRFRTPAGGRVESRCTRPLGRRFGVHVELFAAGRTVLLPAGIGARAPLRVWEGRIAAAGCFGALATLEPTGLVLVRPGPLPTLAALFSAWAQPLSAHRMGPFGGHVAAFVGGRQWRGAPTAIPLRRHSEIVLEVGPYVPPHSVYEFPPGT